MDTLFLVTAHLMLLTSARIVRSPTPPMGWNSYNTFSCSPSEEKIKQSAQGLIDLGLNEIGYQFVTVDCGWPSRDRDPEGRLQWNATLFPSGGKALGDYIHGLGLDFGLYSGAGYLQCGSTDLPASLGFEKLDAQNFAEWGGDSLKYDNCYATSNTTMVDSTSPEAQSPVRFEHMAAELEVVDRDIQYFLCQWGIGTDVGTWGAQIANSWRISNDIYNAWRSIWRITNQVVPYYRNTRAGAFADMDMLIIGLGALSEEEERFHFGMWALNKSPLVIGAALDATRTKEASIGIMSNKEVIAINQDPLARQARLVRRYTEEEWDIWLGELSGSRQILGVANWRNDTQSVEVSLDSLGIQSATGMDVWTSKDLGIVSGIQSLRLSAHELRLWLLTDIVAGTALRPTEYHAAVNASLSGSSEVVQCSVGTCLPVGVKVGNINSSASVAFRGVNSEIAGKRLLGVDFVNYDYAFSTAWEWGDNTRNVTIAVNGGNTKRWAFPLSGGNWEDSDRLIIEVDGFKQGASNEIIFQGFSDNWAPDLVGFEIL